MMNTMFGRGAAPTAAPGGSGQQSAASAAATTRPHRGNRGLGVMMRRVPYQTLGAGGWGLGDGEK